MSDMPADPKLPVAQAVAPAWLQRWASDQFDIGVAKGGPWSRLRIGGATLKAQGAVCRDLFEGRELATYTANFGLLVLLCSLVYGAIVGSFSGWTQAAAASAKFPIVVLGSAILCLPSFYVFQCLAGARLTLAQSAAAIFYFAAAAGLILLACAPIVWFFTISTEATAWRFVTLLHVGVAAFAAGFGVQCLSRAQRYFEWLRPKETIFHRGTLNAWYALYLILAVQMSYYLRPLLSEGPFFTGERGVFTSAVGRLLGVE